MKDRIKEIRLENGLSQAEFANKLNLSRNYLWMLEAGERVPGDRTISDICRIFGVNEVWLRSGEGEMKTPISSEQEIGLFLRRVLNGNVTGLEEALIRFMANTTMEEWEMLNKMLDRFLTDVKDPEAKKETDD